MDRIIFVAGVGAAEMEERPAGGARETASTGANFGTSATRENSRDRAASARTGSDSRSEAPTMPAATKSCAPWAATATSCSSTRPASQPTASAACQERRGPTLPSSTSSRVPTTASS